MAVMLIGQDDKAARLMLAADSWLSLLESEERQGIAPAQTENRV